MSDLGHPRGIGLCLEHCQNTGLLGGRAFLPVTMASLMSTSVTFGHRLSFTSRWKICFFYLSLEE